jgi:hypothetical protein
MQEGLSAPVHIEIGAWSSKGFDPLPTWNRRAGREAINVMTAEPVIRRFRIVRVRVSAYSGIVAVSTKRGNLLGREERRTGIVITATRSGNE